MVSRGEARQIVANALNDMGGQIDLVIVDKHTIERAHCFVFFYNSARYLETGADADRLAGNGPGLVDKASGELRFLWTGKSIDAQIDDFEASRGG